MVTLKGLLGIAFYIYLNIYGFELILYFVKNLKKYISRNIDFKILLILSLWIFHNIVIFIAMSITIHNKNNFDSIIPTLKEIILTSVPTIIWLMTIYCYNILDDIQKDLCFNSTLNTRRKSKVFLKNKIIFNRIGKTLAFLDKHLASVILLKIIVSMFTVMLNIHTFIVMDLPIINKFKHMSIFNFTSHLLDLFLFYLICGSVKNKSDKIYKILDNTRHITISEYKDWFMFKTIIKNCKIGLTIGDFAAFNKSTLLSVSILMIFINIY